MEKHICRRLALHSIGKTTLTNALLAEAAKTSDRGMLIEELQCEARNLVALAWQFFRIWYAPHSAFTPIAFRSVSYAPPRPSTLLKA